MSYLLVDYAEELFLAKDIVGAYRMAMLAKDLDPFFGSVDRYVFAFRVHVAAFRKNRAGEIDWYRVLGVESSVQDEAITHRFCKMGKLICPDSHCSAAAAGAYKLLCMAFEVLGDSASREAFHKRCGLKPPPSSENLEVEESCRPVRRPSEVAPTRNNVRKVPPRACPDANVHKRRRTYVSSHKYRTR